MKNKRMVPVYIITGFLESGKTTLIKDMLSDDGFTTGERTLLLVCEEGVEEYEEDLLLSANTRMISLNAAEDMESGLFAELDANYLPERIIIEYNCMWKLVRLFNVKKPEAWELAQIVALADANTFENYLNNMRAIMTESLTLADLVIFNRCSPNTPKSKFRTYVKLVNSPARILFQNLDGTADDGVSEEDLPYDMTADIIEITDEQFGTWFVDAMNHASRYDGKKLRLHAQAFNTDRVSGAFMLGRYAMTCCINDIQPVGFACKTLHKPPKNEEWLDAIVSVSKRYSKRERRETLTFTLQSSKHARPADDDPVMFN